MIVAIFSFQCQDRSRNDHSNELVIKFSAKASVSQIDSLCNEIGLKKVKDIKQLKAAVYIISTDKTVQQIVEKYKDNPYIEYIEPNYKINIHK